jgi:hypothetical protein
MGVVGQRHDPLGLPTRKRPGTQCTEGLVGPKALLDRCENIVPTGFRSPDRPASTRYPGSQLRNKMKYKQN